ncbi:MAG: agmatinase family protein [Pseudomonadota bacterium]|nr:agmatinase family protein [Pseudomonadota bacterium]
MKIFGVDARKENSKIILLPVPWEVTTSYGGGTSFGPEIINKASQQVDLFDNHFGSFTDQGIFLEEDFGNIAELNLEFKPLARDPKSITKINAASSKVNEAVRLKTSEILKSGKICGVIGGDHSAPFGALQAVAEHFKGDFGILHFDAHADLRESYQGFEFSHASIMNNVINRLSLTKLVQVGIRDYCEEEKHFIESHAETVKTFYDDYLKSEQLKGKPWASLVDEIISELPKNIYISFDIDGLEPSLCPNTGTPVPGGLSFNEISFFLNRLLEKNKKIVGFDLCEVSLGENRGSSEWDANVGARILFKLCGLALRTN